MCLRTIRTRQCTFQRDVLLGVSGQSARARSSSKGACCGESEDYPYLLAHLPRGHAAWGLRSICSRQGTSQWTNAAESQHYPLAQGRLPKRFAAGRLRAIRSREVILRSGFLRLVLGLFSAPFKRTSYGWSHGYLLAPAQLPRGSASWSLGNFRSRQRTFQGDMLRRVSGIPARARALFNETCCGNS